MPDKTKAKNYPNRQSPLVIITTAILLTIIALMLCAMTFSAVGERSLSVVEMTAQAVQQAP